ncbi:hypothetical protein AJ80_03603 [Polytolypa hystricis UAMH7299]|uniref:Uncharacterized protein n=1 Tax=Polytolypa hystricis (strain UAMH7299) TaxID=1447883 RepID=A0A2B7YGD5_POLH7|nr:hypothetical protein AJ80_03603 [Polytolypa hystricis UAMH7299]
MPAQAVLITGCSAGGIGSALAEAFQRQGLLVFATSRVASKMEHLEKLPNVTAIELDVSSPESIADAVSIVHACTGGKLDYLVNNADIYMVMPVLDVDIKHAKKVFDVNLWGVLAVTQAFGHLVIAGQGSVINICSLSGYMNTPWMSRFGHELTPPGGVANHLFRQLPTNAQSLGIYAASKAAMLAYSETLRLEMAPFGVKVLSVVTSFVESSLTADTNELQIELPQTSLYKAAYQDMNARLYGYPAKSKLPVHEYADKVVADVMRGASGRVWRGGMALTARFVLKLMPRSVKEGPLLPEK